MLRKVLHTYATQLSASVATIAVGVVIARVLGPLGKGATSYAIMILGLATVYFGGLMAAVMSQHAKEKIGRRRVYAAALRATGLLAAPVVVVLLALAVAIPSQRVLLAVALALPAALWGLLGKTLLLAEGRVDAANAVDLVASFGFAVTASIVVLAGGGIAGALAGWTLAYAASAVVAVTLLRRSEGREDASGDAEIAELVRRQLAFGTTSGVVYGVGYLNLRVDAFVVAFVLGPAGLGVYSVVTATAEMLWKVSSGVAWSASSRIVGDSVTEVRPLIGKLVRTIIAVELLLGAVAALVGPWLVTALYGPRFAAAGLPLRVILAGVVAYAVEPVLGYFLVVREQRPLTVLAIQGTSAAACGVGTFLLLPILGLTGAALSTSVTYLAVVGVKGWLVARSLDVPLGELLVPRRDDAAFVGRALRRMLWRSEARAVEPVV